MVPFNPPFFYAKYVQWMISTNITLYLLIRSVAKANKRITFRVMVAPAGGELGAESLAGLQLADDSQRTLCSLDEGGRDQHAGCPHDREEKGADGAGRRRGTSRLDGSTGCLG